MSAIIPIATVYVKAVEMLTVKLGESLKRSDCCVLHIHKNGIKTLIV